VKESLQEVQHMSRGTEPTHYPQGKDTETGQITPQTDRQEAPKAIPTTRSKNEDGQGSHTLQPSPPFFSAGKSSLSPVQKWTNAS
jgi:hypothetical protein